MTNQVLSPVLSLVDDESWTHIINLEMIAREFKVHTSTIMTGLQIMLRSPGFIENRLHGAYTSEELCKTLVPLYDQLQLHMQMQMQTVAC